jgi:hypothetical protein
MYRPIFLSLVSLFLVACTPPLFYTNWPIDAQPVARSVSVKRITEDNSTFRVYKVNDENYAILPAINAGTSAFSAINNALIFSPKQLEEFAATANKIVAAHDQCNARNITIIEYHLTMNQAEFVGSSSTLVLGGVANTNSQVFEAQRVAFRLQFVDEGASLITSGKRIEYMFKGATGSMDVKSLKALIGDLKK